jgi:hypothetical protein
MPERDVDAMSNDPAIKKRMTRARRLAADDLRRAGYGIIETQGEPFSIIAVRPSEARFVRVMIGNIATSDLNACRKYSVPANCVREIWALESRGRTFQTKSI